MIQNSNRLATPLPHSVLDRYFAEHPEEVDFRRPPQRAEHQEAGPRARPFAEPDE